MSFSKAMSPWQVSFQRVVGASAAGALAWLLALICIKVVGQQHSIMLSQSPLVCTLFSLTLPFNSVTFFILVMRPSHYYIFFMLFAGGESSTCDFNDESIPLETKLALLLWTEWMHTTIMTEQDLQKAKAAHIEL